LYKRRGKGIPTYAVLDFIVVCFEDDSFRGFGLYAYLLGRMFGSVGRGTLTPTKYPNNQKYDNLQYCSY